MLHFRRGRNVDAYGPNFNHHDAILKGKKSPRKRSKIEPEGEMIWNISILSDGTENHQN